VGGCAAYLHDTSFLRGIKVVYCPLNCTSTLCCNLGAINFFQTVVQEALSTKRLCLVDSGNDVKLIILFCKHCISM